MLAFVYLALAIYLGDQFCRRFYRFASTAHRWAAGILVGLLFSSWFTYLAALSFARTADPLLWANLLFFAIAAGVIIVLQIRSRLELGTAAVFIEPRLPGSQKWDWVAIGMFFAGAGWLMFTTFGLKEGRLQVADVVSTDFGPHTALIQSFAVGRNFPTQYPFFAGEPIRYHFLFYFQAGNLEFLGLDLALSLNTLSVLTMACLLVLVMTLGQLLFHSRTVGRIAAGFFFFHGSLSFIEFLRSQSSLGGALHAILHLKEYLPSGYPYRGETWGLWTQSVFINQRHLAGAIGLFVLVLTFLVDRYPEARSIGGSPTSVPTAEKDNFRLGSFIASGFLLGALPFWNALVFISASAVLFLLLLFFPHRKQMVGLAVAAGVVALPQILFLQSGGTQTPTHPLFQWGYVIEEPTILKVISYLGFSFGLKWLLILFVLPFLSWSHRRWLIAISSLLLIPFLFQFSLETAANHKFLNLWLILANLFAAYGLWRLWHVRARIIKIASRIAACMLAGLIVVSGAIDLFPIYNRAYVEMDYKNDPLLQWTQLKTKPADVFLTDRLVFSPILLAGRKIFYGYTLFTWGAGYDIARREAVYREMFEGRSPEGVLRLLQDNGIAYVVFDPAVRHGDLLTRPNEQLYADHFAKVFEDANTSVTIYQVPDLTPAQFHSLPDYPVTMFEGGKGNSPGEFNAPRGIAIDGSGNILVSDTLNGRVQRFSPEGAFIDSFGRNGSVEGEFSEPNGIAVDPSGNIYLADSGNGRVQKLGPDGTFLAEWRGPEPGFWGPRDVAIGPDGSVYVVDQGYTRIVRFAADGAVLAVWGTAGDGDGQFIEPTAVAVDPKSNRVYVADPRSQRIQVFDSTGNFLSKWTVAEWQGTIWPFQDLIIDAKGERLFASSVTTSEVLVFDLEGQALGSLSLTLPEKLDGASSMALRDRTLYILSTLANRVNRIDLEAK